ncbi:hypothetical protein V1525DRAFT_411534 [Lipomyces kononenkoae]|uniref:Uncharacterized protein n=1 Tax=Lipomyces kononenkoae TaxID=34357 RepID=A0ACC3STK0_LIPKO
MESQERHRKISDARRLIKYQRKGHKLSTQELELVEIYREKERIRQQSFRNARKLVFPPKKRGRKPSAKSTKALATSSMVPSGSDLADRMEKYYNEDVTHQSVASAVDVLINGYNGYRGICFVPIDPRFFANNQHTNNSQIHHGESSPTNLLESANMPEPHRSTPGQPNASSPIYPVTHTASHSVLDVSSHAASGASPTQSCITVSSKSASSLLTPPSSQSPESSAFASQIVMSGLCEVGSHEDTSVCATSDQVISDTYIGFPSDTRRNDSSAPSRDYGPVTATQPSFSKTSVDVLSHSIWTSPEIVQVSPKCSKLQRYELLPYQGRQLQGLLQAWSTADKDRAFDEIVAFVNRVVEEAVDEVRLESTSGGMTIGSNDLTPYDCARILESHAQGEINDILYEFTNIEHKN